MKFRTKEDINKMLVIAQSDMYYKILTTTDINVCTCGDCGSIVFIDTINTDLENIECPYCYFKGEYCDFPDLISV